MGLRVSEDHPKKEEFYLLGRLSTGKESLILIIIIVYNIMISINIDFSIILRFYIRHQSEGARGKPPQGK